MDYEEILETIDYLRNLDLNQLSDEEYADIEQAVIKVWVRSQLNAPIRQINDDLKSSLNDLRKGLKALRKRISPS